MIGVCTTANEGPVKIQYKCLVSIYVFPEMKLWSLLFSKTELLCSASRFLYWYICERFIDFQDQSAYSAARKYVDRSWEYINHSQTHECGNWDWGQKGIHKWDFRCSDVHWRPFPYSAAILFYCIQVSFFCSYLLQLVQPLLHPEIHVLCVCNILQHIADQTSAYGFSPRVQICTFTLAFKDRKKTLICT